ncbi:MAG TPA: hypothetical protein VNG04_03600 [Candidatus Acidoferrum sp.]|nr:hypothetical protein [Candidatus Acidoferrum sp.]
MKGVFGRLGMVGAILVASALIYGAVAGAVIIHRLDSPPAASSTQEQGSSPDKQGEKVDAQGTRSVEEQAAKARPSLARAGRITRQGRLTYC